MGVLNINSGAVVELNDKDAMGYTGSAVSSVTIVNIAGGIMNSSCGSSTEAYKTSFRLTGGTMTRRNGSGQNDGAAYHFTIGYGVTTYGSTATSLISSAIALRDGDNMPFNVASGTTASGIDLNVSGSISEWVAGSGITKSGLGLMQLTGSNTYTVGDDHQRRHAEDPAAAGAMGSVAGPVVDNATLVFNLSNSPTYSGVISGSGASVQQRQRDVGPCEQRQHLQRRHDDQRRALQIGDGAANVGSLAAVRRDQRRHVGFRHARDHEHHHQRQQHRRQRRSDDERRGAANPGNTSTTTTYSGPTTINGGTVQLSNRAPYSTFVLTPSGTLETNYNGFIGGLAGSGTLAIDSSMTNTHGDTDYHGLYISALGNAVTTFSGNLVTSLSGSDAGFGYNGGSGGELTLTGSNSYNGLSDASCADATTVASGDTWCDDQRLAAAGQLPRGRLLWRRWSLPSEGGDEFRHRYQRAY